MKLMHCWTTKWLEAAANAGFAIYKGDGRWEFVDDKMRDMLQEFALEIQTEEREACANLAEEFENDMGYGKARKIADAIRTRSNDKT